MAMMKERGRRALAVGAGVVLIGSLGAGPAFAGSSGSGYDHDYYYSYKCSDYEYSKYYEVGYWYAKYPGEKPPAGEPGAPAPEIPEDLLDLISDLIEGGFLDADATLEDLLALLENPPADLPTDLADRLPSLDDVRGLLPATGTGGSDPVGITSATDAPEEGGSDAPAPPDPVDPPEPVDPVDPVDPAPSSGPSEDDGQGDAGAGTAPSTPSTSGGGAEGTSGADTGSTPGTSSVPVDLKSASRPLDDDEDRDHDRYDYGYWKYGQKKYSYTSYHCYENKEKKHRWYDHREPGEVVATSVRTVPKGGVDTGN